MSDIPEARRLITEVLQLTGVDRPAKLRLQEALLLMRRKPPARRATAQPENITPEIRDEVCRLATTTQLTFHQIAEHVGLRNIGRVSDILNGNGNRYR